MKLMLRHIALVPTVAAMLLLLPACSSSGAVEPTESTAGGTSTLRVTIAADSRADDPAVESDDELIQDWWVAFVDGKNRVERIVSRAGGVTTPIEQDHFSLELPNGIYRVYAFANISHAQLAEATGVTFTEGMAAPSMAAAQWGVNLNQWPDNAPPIFSSALPMTGYIQALQVAQSSSCDIEVVRLVAKVRFNVIDRTVAGTATVRSITISPITEGPCELMPDYFALGTYYEPSSTDGLSSRELTLSVADGATTAMAYLRESSAADGMPAHNPSNHFQLRLSLSRNGSEAVDYYVLTDELLSLRRNDYVTIPLVLTDYALELAVRFYPPIGGYPAVVVEPQGDDYTVTFGSTGDFAIAVLVRDETAPAGSQPVPPEAIALTVSDPAGIFAAAPSVDPTTGEILGELGSARGAAQVMLKVTVAQSSGVSYTFSRTLHILRQ